MSTYTYSDPASVEELIDHEKLTGYASSEVFEAHASDAAKLLHKLREDVRIFYHGHPIRSNADAKIPGLERSIALLEAAADVERRREIEERAERNREDTERGIAWARKNQGTLFPLD